MSEICVDCENQNLNTGGQEMNVERFLFVVEPEFKYVGNMHGNEVVSREVLLKLAVDLCDRYRAGDEMVKELLRTTRVHIMPTMNPDGWEIANAEVRWTF